jgi:hypothetical protein
VNGVGHMGSVKTTLNVHHPRINAVNDEAVPLKVPMFTQVKDGEWFQLASIIGHKMACCDCGLVHTMNFRIVDGNIQIQAIRDEQATADRRECSSGEAEGKHL